ncbi:hypothetical protein Z946_65 [Sulfitobacter noctilucicola]|nr:hypothetical protein Z946_65 [Sulfitobacter noctilucicola]
MGKPVLLCAFGSEMIVKTRSCHYKFHTTGGSITAPVFAST